MRNLSSILYVKEKKAVTTNSVQQKELLKNVIELPGFWKRYDKDNSTKNNNSSPSFDFFPSNHSDDMNDGYLTKIGTRFSQKANKQSKAFHMHHAPHSYKRHGFEYWDGKNIPDF